MSPQQILTTVRTCIIVDKSTDSARPHLICFLHNILSKKENVIFSGHKLKKALRDMLSGLVSTIAR